MKMMKKIGLIGLLGVAAVSGSGCTKNDISKIGEDVKITRPENCATVQDLRYEFGYANRDYQILCKDKSGNLALYRRDRSEDSWTKIYVADAEYGAAKCQEDGR